MALRDLRLARCPTSGKCCSTQGWETEGAGAELPATRRCKLRHLPGFLIQISAYLPGDSPPCVAFFCRSPSSPPPPRARWQVGRPATAARRATTAAGNRPFDSAPRTAGHDRKRRWRQIEDTVATAASTCSQGDAAHVPHWPIVSINAGRRNFSRMESLTTVPAFRCGSSRLSEAIAAAGD